MVAKRLYSESHNVANLVTYTLRICGNLFLGLSIDLFDFLRVQRFLLQLYLAISRWVLPSEPGPAHGFFLLKGSFSMNFQNLLGSSLFKLFCFRYLSIKSQDSLVNRTPCSPTWPRVTQILSPEPDNTLRQQRTTADTLCIDSVCLVFQVAMDRVSTKREEEGGTCPGKDPEGEQLLTAQKIHFIMGTYWY